MYSLMDTLSLSLHLMSYVFREALKQGRDKELNQVKTRLVGGPSRYISVCMCVFLADSLTELQCREREAAAALHTLQVTECS